MKLASEDRVGFRITVILHLAVILGLLLVRVGTLLPSREEFLIDFSKEEAPEQARKEKAEEEGGFDEEISRKIDRLLSGTSGVEFRNVAVDRAALKDDRGTDAQRLYEDADALARELKSGYQAEEDGDYAELPSRYKKREPPAQTYSGPSVVSCHVEGRKASRLPIPAYRCFGGGMVTVLIAVNNAGKVVEARIQEEASSTDSCLREFAVRAARLSRFSASPTAPPRQGGMIVYQFIAQ